METRNGITAQRAAHNLVRGWMETDPAMRFTVRLALNDAEHRMDFFVTLHDMLSTESLGSGMGPTVAGAMLEAINDHETGQTRDYEPNAANTTVADTILEQLTRQPTSGRAMGVLAAMIGAHGFVAAGDGVRFKWKARAENGANTVVITLDPSDTYNVAFWSVRGAKNTFKGKFDDIYAESLTELFERETKLYLRF